VLYLSREEFEERHPRTANQADISTVVPGNLTIDSDMIVKGIIEGDVRVCSGVQASITGVIKGSLDIQPEGTVYLTGVIEGDARVDGNILLIGVVQGQVHGGNQAQIATGSRSWR
jgi:cytoskeletal protein CcmA (bactofilin family)